MPTKPDPRQDASFEAGPGFLLWRLSNRWQAAQRAALKPLGLTHVRFVLLASLAALEDGDPITQRRLSQHVALDPMMTSQVLRVLEDDGLVERRHHPADGRARSLHTTAKGRELALEATVVVEGCDELFFAQLGGDARAFIERLATLAG
jgi:DNA-binding MarR family transcriptional regulator